jgi:CBS domain containing-hemolysin-like protein
MALPLNADAATLVKLISTSPADVLPVYSTSLDHIVGVVHLRHLVVPLSQAPAALNLSEYVCEIPSVPLRTSLARLLALMRRTVSQHALVMDEYGGTAGLVTFDDLLERIAGSAGEAESLKALRMTTLDDGSAMVDGLMLVADFNVRFGTRLDERSYTTVGGYVLGRIGRRAAVGDRVGVEGRLLRVEAVDGARVAWVSVSTSVQDRTDAILAENPHE